MAYFIGLQNFALNAAGALFYALQSVLKGIFLHFCTASVNLTCYQHRLHKKNRFSRY